MSCLRALYVDCVRSLWGIFALESDFVAFADFVKRDADKIVAVEEQVFFLAFDGDEAKAFVVLLLDDTVHVFEN